MKSMSPIGILAAMAIGLTVGLGVFTFGYAKGYAYLSNDPAPCANCHIMSEHYAAWVKSSHRAVAVCNDCHTPHTFVGKYVTKARNGFWHSFYFTTGRYPDPLRITARNRRVTEDACRFCHGEITAAIDPAGQARGSSGTAVAVRSAHSGESASCIRCHAYVGHLVQ